MTKTIDTVVSDVYHVLDDGKSHVDQAQTDIALNNFMVNVETLVRENILEREEKGATLRMSAIGKGARQLWYQSQDTEEDFKLQPHTRLLFMYGHLIEELLLMLVRLSGHKVENEQRKVTVEGVSGSMDCTIDDVLIDVKSASPYGFQKFRDNTVEWDDSFGYVDQLKGYGHALGVEEGGWLAMDKSSGQLALAMIDLTEGRPVTERIKYLKEVVASDTPPERCYEPVPEGKSGNMKINKKCNFCPYKKTCFPDLRSFKYSNGITHLVHVAKEPKVPEIT